MKQKLTKLQEKLPVRQQSEATLQRTLLLKNDISLIRIRLFFSQTNLVVLFSFFGILDSFRHNSFTFLHFGHLYCMNHEVLPVPLHHFL